MGPSTDGPFVFSYLCRCYARFHGFDYPTRFSKGRHHHRFVRWGAYWPSAHLGKGTVHGPGHGRRERGHHFRPAPAHGVAPRRPDFPVDYQHRREDWPISYLWRGQRSGGALRRLLCPPNRPAIRRRFFGQKIPACPYCHWLRSPLWQQPRRQHRFFETVCAPRWLYGG